MEFGFLIFWVGINALIGYLIGQKKNQIGECIALSILLGPIGWLIAALIPGNLRNCPFCAEPVKPEAIVCPHCQRDLPPASPTPPTPWLPPAPPMPPQTPEQRKRQLWIAGSIVTVVLGILLWAALYARERARAEERRAEAVKSYYSSSAAAAPSPAPEFIKITSSVSVYDSAANEIKLTPGMRLQVVARFPHERVTVLYNDAPYSIASAFTQPAP